MIVVDATKRAIEELARLPQVRVIELDGAMTDPFAGERAEKSPAATTDSVDWGNGFWNLDRIGTYQAHNQGIRGGGAIVGIIDTGVNVDHQELNDSYWCKGYSSSYGCWHDAVNSDDKNDPGGTPYDDHGHGTGVLAVAVGNTVGIAPDAVWIACKSSAPTSGGGSAPINRATLIECMEWMLAPDGVPAWAPDVVNMSNGIDAHRVELENAAKNLAWADIVLVAAAGNSGASCQTVAFPAAYPGVLGVGSLSIYDTIAPSSSRGPSTLNNSIIKPDVVAPGTYIYTAGRWSGTYTWWNGTSFAAPHVTGLVALIRGKSPYSSPDWMIDYLIPELSERKAAINCAGSYASINNDYGWGVINIPSTTALFP
ncbi:MAG: S8 family serine peptidase [Roseiflexaceae bacterium]|nr:S8 family serine peptidase [Roseiflexaceae bacterium]